MIAWFAMIMRRSECAIRRTFPVYPAGLRIRLDAES